MYIFICVYSKWLQKVMPALKNKENNRMCRFSSARLCFFEHLSGACHFCKKQNKKELFFHFLLSILNYKISERIIHWLKSMSTAQLRVRELPIQCTFICLGDDDDYYLFNLNVLWGWSIICGDLRHIKQKVLQTVEMFRHIWEVLYILEFA